MALYNVWLFQILQKHQSQIPLNLSHGQLIEQLSGTVSKLEVCTVLMLRFTPHHHSGSGYATLKVSVRVKFRLYTLFSTMTHKTAFTAHLLFVIRHTVSHLCFSFLLCVCVSPQVLAQQETDRSKELPGVFGSPQKSPRKSPGSRLRSDLL